MEENEKIDSTINSENNVNKQSSNSEIKTRNKKVTIVLISVIIVLLVAIGVCAGLWFAGDTTKIINNKEEVVKEEEKNTSKKIDETKLWVYDADYNKETKIVYETSDKSYFIKSDECLKVPFININSDDAKKVNEEIKNLYEEWYSGFGKVLEEQTDWKTYQRYDAEYKIYENENILSVVLQLHDWEVVVDGGTGGGIYTVYTYNFNLETLKLATLDEMSKVCGFNSEKEVTSKINTWEQAQFTKAEKNPDLVIAIFEGVEDGKYFIDEDGKLNFLYKSTASSEFVNFEIVEPGKEIVDFYDFEENNSDSSNNLYNQEMFECEYFKMVLPTSWEGKYRVEYEEQGNRKDYRFVENEHMETLFTITISNGKLEGNAPYTTLYDTNGTTEYYYTTRGDSPVYLEPISSMLGDFSGIENNLYVKKTLTNEYGNGTKTINVYGRQFIPIAGATGRESIYYINQNSMLCKTNLVDLSTEILASSVKDIQIDQNNIIHAYPIGDSFMNNIAMEDEFVVFENVN